MHKCVPYMYVCMYVSSQNMQGTCVHVIFACKYLCIYVDRHNVGVHAQTSMSLYLYMYVCT